MFPHELSIASKRLVNFPSETLAWYYFAKVIAAAVASNKEKYNEAFLGKHNEEYCAWILNPEKWGGIFA